MPAGNGYNAPLAGDDVGEESAPCDMKIASTDLAGSREPGEDRLEFHDAESGQKMLGPRLREEGIDGWRSEFNAVMFGGGARVEKLVCHPATLVLAIVALDSRELGKRS